MKSFFLNFKNSLIFWTIIIAHVHATAKNYYDNPISPKITSKYDCAPPAMSLATIQPIQSGAWNQDSTWLNGVRPTINDDVIVPAGITLTLIGNCNAQSVTVNGKLRANNAQSNGTWFNLTTKYIMVMGQNAEMEIGTKEQPYISTEGGTINLTGANRNELIPGTNVNSKAIMVMNGATMNLHGNPKVSWVKIGSQTPVGSTSITLAEAVDWEVGDQVVISSNRLEAEEAEERVISAISFDGRTISFATPLQYPRMGELSTYSNGSKTWTMDTRVEVGLLTRNITIQGDTSTTDANRYGAHVMIMNGSTGNADNVEFFRMGQGGTLGRYPWHWHLLGAAGNGQYITNCSIRKSYNRAITVHGTWGTLVDNNVAYDHRGHGIFLEDGSEIDNVFSNNLVLLSRKPLAQDALLDSDFDFSEPQNASPSAFWITNPDNSFINNVVAGTEGTAYWFAFPDSPTGDSGSIPALANLKPRETELKEFLGNSAHSSQSGFDINDALNQNHVLKKNFGFTVDNPFIIQDFTLFSNNINIYAGIGGGLENIIFDNTMSSDAKFHTMLATRATLQNSVFISDTGNGLFNSNEQKSLNLLYDGALRMFDSHLVDWDRNDSSIFDNNGAGNKFINHLVRGITYNHTGSPRINIAHQWLPPNDNDHNCLRTFSNVIQDLDGSLTRTGVPSSLVSETDFNMFDNSYQFHNWDGLHSVPESFALLRTTNNGAHTMTRKKMGCSISKVFSASDCEGVPYSTYHFTLDDAQNQYEHAIYYSSFSGNNMTVVLNNDRQVGKAMTVRFKGFGNLNNVGINGINESNGIAQVKNSNTTAYYVEDSGDLYVKFMLENKLLTTTYVVSWGSGNLPVLNKYNEEPDLMNAYVTTSSQSGCTATATVHIENNTQQTQLQVSLDGGQTYTQTFNDNVGTRSFNNIPVGTLIYARWSGQSCGQPIGMVKNNQENASCNNDLPDNIPPVASFESPNGDQFDGGADLGVVVNASDSDGVIANVILFINDVLVRQENGAPYEWGTANVANEDPFLLNLSSGNYILKAQATDNSGLTTTISKEISVSASIPIGNNDTDGDGINDDIEVENCGNPNNASDLNFEFSNSSEDFERFNTAADNISSDQYWLIRADNSNDPYVVRNDLAFNGSQVPQLKIRVKSQATGTFQLFWKTLAQSSYSQARSVSVTPQVTNVFEELVFDMSNLNTWMGQTITSIRLDFPPDPTAASHTWIDYIQGPEASSDPCSDDTLYSGIPIGATIWLKSLANDKYVRNKDTGGDLVEANTTNEQGVWVPFIIEDAGDGTIALKSGTNGKYVAADIGVSEDAPLYANRDEIGSWEKFTWINNFDGTISLKANSSNMYVSADLKLGDNAPLMANRIVANEWEKFYWGTFSSSKVVILAESSVLIYPNPVASTATIANAVGSKLNIYNLHGIQVFNKVISSESEVIDLQHLTTGVYYAEVIGAIESSIVKIVKK